MGFSRSFNALLSLSLLVKIEARHMQPFKHEAARVDRRQIGSPPQATQTSSTAATITSPAVMTYIMPSPGATPVAVTEESQLVTTYVPQYTLCELPPLAFFPVTPLPSSAATTAPYQNYSISTPPDNGTCTTIYRPTETMICATTLTGLVQKYTITNCAQDITFSTEYGYVLTSPTAPSNSSAIATPGTAPATTHPEPLIQSLTTYYLAPWQAVTAGTAPSEVTLKVCTTYANGTSECVHQYEVWHTSLLTHIATRTTAIDISTTIHGTSQLIVETLVANVTEQITTFTLVTTLALEYSTETETTLRASATPTTGPTSYLTVTVEEATPRPSSSSSGLTTTRTSTVHRTSTTTVYAGTSTSTLPAAGPAASTAEDTALPTPSYVASPSHEIYDDDDDDDEELITSRSSVDWASLLEIPTAMRS